MYTFAIILFVTVLNPVQIYSQQTTENFDYTVILDKYSDYSLDADIETYRGYAERLVQGAGGVISSMKGSSNSSSTGGITGFLKKSVQIILTPVRKIAAVAGKGFGTFLNNNKDRLRAIFPGRHFY